MGRERGLVLALGGWLGAALLVQPLGLVRFLEPPAPQLVLVGLTLVLAVLYWRVGGFRRALDALPLETLVAVHITRFVGFYFLVLYGQGRLPYDFAVLGGWGDIVVATGAVALVVLRGVGRPAGRLALATWNTIGLLDILFVVSTATRLALADVDSMRELLQLPLLLLPTFLVPLILFTHGVLAVRLWRDADAAAA